MATRTSTLVKLDFTEKLVQSGKSAGSDALLKRLKTLSIKLNALEQDYVDTKSLEKVRKQLIDPIILHHKEKGIKAYAACCIADILRLYAPEAPYTGEELRDIFMFFVDQLNSGLKYTPPRQPLAPAKNKANETQTTLTGTTIQPSRIAELPYYDQYSRLLDSLATVKSVVLICDVPGSEDLITSYFDNFVEIVRADMNRNIVRYLVDILVTVIEEAESIPSGVMDCIITQFDTFATKPETPSFQLIVDVCNRTADKLQRPVFAHFSEIQLEHGRDPSPSDLKALADSHSLLITIFRHAPGLLLNVIPQLEENLRAADEVPLRQLSTRTLGIMFGERPVVSAGVVDVARAYPATWRAWLGRKVDKALPVRLAWVEAARGILSNQPEIRKELEDELVDRTQDADERVRAAICKTIGSLNYATALHHVSTDLLKAIGNRMSDKKSAVRAEAIAALAKLWGLAYSEIEANSAEAIQQFGWIPQEMLRSAFRREAGVDLRTQISAAVKKHILPLPAKPDDEQAWVDRFLLVACHLDEMGLIALDRMTGLVGFARGSSPWGAFVASCEENNGGVIDINEKEIKARLGYVINAIAAMYFADTDKARKDLESFAAVNEPRLYKLLTSLSDPQSDLRTIIKSKNELLRRIEQSHNELLETFTVIVDNAGWGIINQSSIAPLIKRVQKPEGQNSTQAERSATIAARYLTLIAKECAPMYKSHVAELVIVINEKKRDKLVEVGLQALAAVSKWDSASGPSDRKPVDRAIALALTGTPRQAKFATRFVASCQFAETASFTLVDSIWTALQKRTKAHLLTLLRSCSELALVAPAAFETRTEEIIKFVMDEVMLARSPSEGDDDDETWVEEEKLDVLDRAKLIGMRICTHRSLGWARDENAITLVQPTLNLLASILPEGQVSAEETAEGGKVRGHMRLRAALCLLKLANVKAFDKDISKYFAPIAFTLQDPIFVIRQKFLQKLGDKLPGQRLMPKWNVVPVMVAQDPEPENVEMARALMLHIVRTCQGMPTESRIDRVEMPLARLLYLLTNHPDLDFEDHSELKNMSKFLELFIDCVANRDNISLLLHIASKLKTVRLVHEPVTEGEGEDRKTASPRRPEDLDTKPVEQMPQPGSQSLYKLCELAQFIIKNRAAMHQWPLTAYPGKVRLPGDIFHNLANPQLAQRVAGWQYLPQEIVEWARSLGKKAMTSSLTRRVVDNSLAEPKKRRKVADPNAPTRKKRRPSNEEDEDDSEDEDEEEDDDDDEEDEDEEMDVDEEEDGEGAVMGRGGRRSAKTKANKAVSKRSRVKKSKNEMTGKQVVKKVTASDEESDLTDEDE